jgi:hypothetical protein
MVGKNEGISFSLDLVGGQTWRSPNFDLAQYTE